MSAGESYLTGLNPGQLEAVMATEGPVIVLAGAGSGKTKTLTARVVHLLSQGVEPRSILAVTFTNKAAKEMKERVARAIAATGGASSRWSEPWMGFSQANPEVSTFHSFCLKLLRAEPEAAGLAPNFVIYDDQDQLSVLKRTIEQLGLEGRLANAKAYQSGINNAKTLALSPADLRAREARGPFEEKLVEVYELYENALAANQAVDFGEIIVRAWRLFERRPEILAKYQERFRFLMVDEYQDTNRAQYLLISRLAGKYRNLCVVGDEDQSIYKWRGADIRNILDFQTEYPDARLVKLEENYRSTKMIIDAAASVIRNNQGRYDKTLFTNNPEGDPVRIVELGDERAEGDYVAKRIREALSADSRLGYRDVAIFYRSHAQSRAIEESLRRERAPYRILGGAGFYDRKEIKDVLAYIRMAANPKDSVSLERVINVPARGIGKTTVDKLAEHAGKCGISMAEAIGEVVRGQVDFLGNAAVKKLTSFYDFFKGLTDASQKESLADLYQRVVHDSGYLAELKAEGTEEAKGRIENLEEFYNVVQTFDEEAESRELSPGDGLRANFLNQITLESQALEAAEAAGGTISLMTLHSSKGLEFPVVILVGCEEGIFPSKRALEESEWEDSAIEEERRLCYVGMTRAMRHLTMTHVSVRRIYGQVQVAAPSRFLGEIPDRLKRVEGKSHMAPTVSWSSVGGREGRSSLERRYDFADSEPSPVEIAPSYGNNGEALEVGRKVKHEVYGKGTIRAIEGADSDRKVTIEFSGYQKKNFLARHLKLELLRNPKNQ